MPDRFLIQHAIPIGAEIVIQRPDYFFRGRLVAGGVAVEITDRPNLLGLVPALCEAWHAAKRGGGNSSNPSEDQHE